MKHPELIDTIHSNVRTWNKLEEKTNSNVKLPRVYRVHRHREDRPNTDAARLNFLNIQDNSCQPRFTLKKVH